MDFPAQCLTNVTKIDGFSSISYRVFSLAHSNNLTSGRDVPPNIHNSETLPLHVWTSLRKLELSCKEAGILACIRPRNDELWLFEAGEQPSALNERVGDPINRDDGVVVRLFGLECTELKSGILRASALETRPSAIRRSIASSAATPSAGEHTMRSAQAANARSAQVNASVNSSKTVVAGAAPTPAAKSQRPTDETLALYELFISATISAISYLLAKHHNYLPVDFRTFLSPSRQPSRDSEDESPEVSCFAVQSVSLETIDVRLTSMGTLVVSSRCLQPSALRQMPYTSAIPEYTDIWLAPGGRVARYLGSALSPNLVEEDPHLSESSCPDRRYARYRTRISDKEQRWQTEVRNWLCEHGIFIGSNDAEAWLKVQIQPGSRHPVANQPNSDDHMASTSQKLNIISWPARLCFGKILLNEAALTTCDTDIGPDSGLHDGLEWLLTPEHGGVQDPLTFAEDWFAGQEEREQYIKSKVAAREIAKMSVDSAITNIPSQMQSPAVINALRTSNYGDLQAAGGFYPTPPDGVQFHGAAASSLPDAPAATPASATDQPVYDNGDVRVDDINSSGDPAMKRPSIEDIDIEYAQRGESGNFRGEDDPSNVDQSTNNERFEELDEAMFGGNAVTEEDFSFFDGPDMDDFGLGTGEQYPITSAEDGALTLTADCDLAAPFGSTKDLIFESNTENFDGTVTGDGSIQGTDELDKVVLNTMANEHTGNQDTSIGFLEPGATLDSAGFSGSEKTFKINWQDLDLLSPPLSPVLVKIRLLPETNIAHRRTSPSEQSTLAKGIGNTILAQSRQQSNFDAVTFNRALNLTDHKYASEGRFWFLANATSTKETSLGMLNNEFKDAVLPEIGLLENENKCEGDGLRAMITQVAGSPALRIQASPATPPSDDESCDSLIKDEELPHTTRLVPFEKVDRSDERIQEARTSVKRKRDSDDGFSDGAPSPQRPSDLTLDNGILAGNASTPWEMLSPDAAARSIAEYFCDTNNKQGSIFGMEGEQLVTVAQILADQIIFGTLQPLRDKTNPGLLKETLQRCHPEHPNGRRIKEAIKSLFHDATPCDLYTFLAIEDLPPEIPPVGRVPIRPVHRRASTNKSGSSDNCNTGYASTVFKLSPSHVRVRRAEATMDILSSALPFWETFGLSPCSGSKNVLACCVFPRGQGVENAATNFFERISTSYESCRLGSHTLARGFKCWESGMIPVSLDGLNRAKYDLEFGLQQFQDTCTLLGKKPHPCEIYYSKHLTSGPQGQYLLAIPSSGQNIVIYMVNPFEHPTALIGLSAAFARLSRTYSEYPVYQDYPTCKIVLQIIPIDFITRVNSLVIPSQREYMRLALEVYERCGAREESTISQLRMTRRAPSIALAKPVPKRIGFKLSSEPPASLLHETPCLHIAYSQSFDNRWLSAAWTDNQGHSQTSVSYCLGIKASSHPLRPFREVAEEIWRTTLDMIATRKVTWRVFIVKVGVMDRKEVDLWTAFATQQSPPVATMILLGADPNPTLSVQPLSLPLTSSGFNPQTGTYTTPVATPQPSALSPDQFGNSTTPSAALTSSTGAANAQTPTDTPIDLDANATLIDITDETWGLIPSHRLHNTHSLIDINPALVSGYLLKRASTHDETPLAVMSVNLLWVSGGQQQRPTAVLKEVLGMYRGLSTLARAKGVIDERSTEPWHVAAARKAVAGVGWLL
ncbi:MAG: hypothetical protein M1812_006456 [Candelaria pacifica]|nr:MAG: hypothetical protein M1812_006456 [Candelaria pacifica]